MILNGLPFGVSGFAWYLVRICNVESGAEIGVYKGEMAGRLLKANQNLKLYLVDPWKHLPVEEYDDVSNQSDEVFEPMYQMIQGLVKPYPNAKILRMRSQEALDLVPDESLDFVYIDGNHRYEHVKADIIGWEKKVRKEGIVSGDDFTITHQGVCAALSEVTTAKDGTIFHDVATGLWLYIKK